MEFSYGDPFFFCGLYKTWGDLLSCSIITLEAHPATKKYHEKSLPMVAPEDTDFVERWVGGGEDTEAFEPYLHPHIEHDGRPLLVQPVARATSTEYVGERQEVG